MNKHIKLYAEIVKKIGEFSTDEKLKVGALLLKDWRIISTGYNGQPSKQPHKQIIQESHDVSTVHAEMNCLCFAAKNGIQIEGCDIFLTHFPCVHCTKMLYQSGIKTIYYINDYRNEDNPYFNILNMVKINDN